ncbi:hypothetical protein D3C74_152770 [compost metagenome]
MNDTVDCDIRQSLDRTSSQMRRDYSESLRELNLYVGQENLLYTDYGLVMGLHKCK